MGKKNLMKINFYIYLIILYPSLIFSQRISAPITIDGLFNDWAAINVADTDELGDGGEEDFEYLKIANDNNFLFIFLEFQFDEILMPFGCFCVYI